MSSKPTCESAWLDYLKTGKQKNSWKKIYHENFPTPAGIQKFSEFSDNKTWEQSYWLRAQLHTNLLHFWGQSQILDLQYIYQSSVTWDFLCFLPSWYNFVFNVPHLSFHAYWRSQVDSVVQQYKRLLSTEVSQPVRSGCTACHVVHSSTHALS